MRFPDAVLGLVLATQLCTACSTVDRSLIFFTNTTTGLEVSSGSASTDPVHIVLGYKRQEGVLNPVYDPAGIDISAQDASGHPLDHVKKYRDEAYSVIAKYQGGTSAGASGASASSTNGQWFATGKAATLLAEQPGIAGAVTGNSAIADAAAKQAQPGKLSEVTREANLSLLVDVDAGLGDLGSDPNKPDKQAQTLHDRLTALDATPFQPAFTMYKYEPKQAPGLLRSYPYKADDPSASFRHVITRWAALSASIDDLRAALMSGTALTEPESSDPISKDRRTALSAELSKLESIRADFETQLLQNPAVSDAVDYFVKTVEGK